LFQQVPFHEWFDFLGQLSLAGQEIDFRRNGGVYEAFLIESGVVISWDTSAAGDRQYYLTAPIIPAADEG
jgi:hypothetical protein